ncbi:MAG: hypothetical protein K2Q06_05535 [Parvularculaceae bacterium]|nr:hypothetical protein [Parvularculaceae bacterium]
MRRNLMLRTGLLLLTLIGVFYLAFGALYVSVGDYLFFHKAALPAGSEAGFRPLYLGLMKLIGGASIALGGLGLLILHTSVRARHALSLGGLAAAWAAPLVVAGYVAETLRRETGAPTSANLMAILLAVLVAGAALRAFSGSGGK